MRGICPVFLCMASEALCDECLLPECPGVLRLAETMPMGGAGCTVDMESGDEPPSYLD
jgi:hypothetical protein